MRLLVTGGAGFVGSSLAILFKAAEPDADVVTFDNLRRRGSELNLPRLKAAGVRFAHGDVRSPSDLALLGAFDWLIECSAEPSVHAGYGSDPRYVVDTNLGGAINCLNHLRQTGGRLIFLSSSRVYPIEPLRDLPLEEKQSRFALEKGNAARGWSPLGINESFPLAGVRSLYGATKLAAELLIQEFGSMYDMPAVVNRCGVIAGPWQMGKVDQGFVALWVARHFFGRELSYIGFGGSGRQVRDVLDIRDLFDLIVLQMSKLEICGGHIYNVGGGVDRSTSLVELTKLTQEVTGRSIIVGRNSKTTVADVPYYVSDNSRVSRDLGWTPKRTTRETIESIYEWLQDNTEPLRALFDPNCP